MGKIHLFTPLLFITNLWNFKSFNLRYTQYPSMGYYNTITNKEELYMETISEQIKALQNQYAKVSVAKVQEICDLVGVEYRDPKFAKDLVADLKNKGMVLSVEKFAEPDVMVGQQIVLRDLEGRFVKGYKVWIDFKENFSIKEKELTEEDIIGVVH